jgi:hypothetical protein
MPPSGFAHSRKAAVVGGFCSSKTCAAHVPGDEHEGPQASCQKQRKFEHKKDGTEPEKPK